MPEINPEDRYRLRRAYMDAEKKALEEQKAQQELERLLLEMEYKHGLLETGQTIDPRTGAIHTTAPTRKGNGKDSVQALEAAVASEPA